MDKKLQCVAYSTFLGKWFLNSKIFYPKSLLARGKKGKQMNEKKEDLRVKKTKLALKHRFLNSF